ncbi:MAG: sporulation protein YabP [Defluviitaleaceae bacterium]|nr:sporulation protein YabP [Defluviitaleaceae bacterium]
MFESNIEKPHKLTATGRENAQITGVSEVLTFDDGGIVCRTDLGVLKIKGAGMRVLNLNTETGALDIAGSLDSFTYDNSFAAKGKQGVFGKIFK